LVDITLPTPYHADTAVRALEAGKHVIIEKPLALTLPEVDRMIAAADASGKFLLPAHVLRFWPEYSAIHDLVHSGQLGRPILASSYRLSNLPQWAEWFKRPEMTGGAVFDMQIHELDFLNSLFGKPVQVFSQGAQEPNGSWNHVVTQLEYSDGVTTVSESSFSMPRDYPFSAGVRVLCERGTVEYAFRASGANFQTGAKNYLVLHEPGKPDQPVSFTPGDAFENELAYFVNCVRAGKLPETVTAQDGRLAVQICQASLESLLTRQPVALAG
ncbi:MAG: gfo/Idh/MocA family oxidoreductase, partial [Chloroflexi bacterium]